MDRLNWRGFYRVRLHRRESVKPTVAMGTSVLSNAIVDAKINLMLLGVLALVVLKPLLANPHGHEPAYHRAK